MIEVEIAILLTKNKNKLHRFPNLFTNFPIVIAPNEEYHENVESSISVSFPMISVEINKGQLEKSFVVSELTPKSILIY